MPAVRPWGDPIQASILIIGQNPHLQKSKPSLNIHFSLSIWMDARSPTHPHTPSTV